MNNLIRNLAILTLALTLAACTTPKILKGEGEAETPPGYVKLCIEHPHLAACPRTDK